MIWMTIACAFVVGVFVGHPWGIHSAQRCLEEADVLLSHASAQRRAADAAHDRAAAQLLRIESLRDEARSAIAEASAPWSRIVEATEALDAAAEQLNSPDGQQFVRRQRETVSEPPRGN